MVTSGKLVILLKLDDKSAINWLFEANLNTFNPRYKIIIMQAMSLHISNKLRILLNGMNFQRNIYFQNKKRLKVKHQFAFKAIIY